MHYITPEPRDVLCGRGISCHQHPGNKYLRELIDRNLPKYAAADSKSDKSSILREIIRSILQQGGRFLKKDSDTEFYYEAGMKAARDKVGHCLREAMAERYSRVNPMANKPTAMLVPKPLANLTPRGTTLNLSNLNAQGRVTDPVQLAVTPSQPIPSIVSDADITESYSYYDDESCNSSTASMSVHTLPRSSEFVDALYELPTQGEWEQLILPLGGSIPFSDPSDLVAV